MRNRWVDLCHDSLRQESAPRNDTFSKEEQYILSALSRSNPYSHGYIVFKENEAFGIGNVYRSFASVLLLAMVTNRTLFGRSSHVGSRVADYSHYFVYFKPKLPVVLDADEESIDLLFD